MKILLLGEYSGFHNSLKKGLAALGHQVVIVGNGDGFKKFPVDIALEASWFKKKWFLKKTKNLIFSLTNFDLADLEIYFRYRKIAYLLKGYDVIQLINSVPFLASPVAEKKILTSILTNNCKSSVFLHGGGTDVPWVNYMLYDNHEGFSSLTPFKKNRNLKPFFSGALKYTKSEYKSYYKFVLEKLTGIIPSDIDYEIVYRKQEKAVPMISAPVDYTILKYEKIKITEKIVIFCGINTTNQYGKGIPFFLEALAVIKNKYPDQILVKITEDLPYNEYIRVYDECHIFLDQCYSYDQGYNGREAMAKGKVVFSGANQDFREHYKLTEDELPLVEARPDVQYLVSKLSELIENPHKLTEISIRARKFIEKHHNHIDIAQQYLDTWTFK